MTANKTVFFMIGVLLVVLGFSMLINPSKKVMKKNSPDVPIQRQGSGVR